MPADSVQEQVSRDFIVEGGIRYVQFDSTRAAGFTEALRIAELAEQHGGMVAHGARIARASRPRHAALRLWCRIARRTRDRPAGPRALPPSTRKCTTVI
jgi:L-alanine-DL-glutamate epimerase-like enolase superfamily enzyme